MMMARFTILFKNKNSKLNLDNQRATKVASVTGRVVQKIILRRHFSQWVNKEINDCQYGFQPRKSYEQSLCHVNCLLLEHEHEGRTLATASIDIKKMFPRIDLSIAINEVIVNGGSLTDIIFLVYSCFGKLQFSKITRNCRVKTPFSMREDVGRVNSSRQNLPSLYKKSCPSLWRMLTLEFQRRELILTRIHHL